ncbi:MAG: hypothetical protein M1838_006109 [Thelocarpon superellum]|nr:MAG: hypothetical protein M1838_006109 [Thelocarpon superellum]
MSSHLVQRRWAAILALILFILPAALSSPLAAIAPRQPQVANGQCANPDCAGAANGGALSAFANAAQQPANGANPLHGSGSSSSSSLDSQDSSLHAAEDAAGSGPFTLDPVPGLYERPLTQDELDGLKGEPLKCSSRIFGNPVEPPKIVEAAATLFAGSDDQILFQNTDPHQQNYLPRRAYSGNYERFIGVTVKTKNKKDYDFTNNDARVVDTLWRNIQDNFGDDTRDAWKHNFDAALVGRLKKTASDLRFITGQAGSPRTKQQGAATGHTAMTASGVVCDETFEAPSSCTTLEKKLLQSGNATVAPYQPFAVEQGNFASGDFTIGAGVAIFHVASARVVLCWHSRDDYWFLPKGRRDVFEDSTVAAEREGFEEARPAFVTEPIWIQLMPVTPTTQYLLHWYIAETLPPDVEDSLNAATGVLSASDPRPSYQRPPTYPPALTLAERCKLEPAGYNPVRHENTGVDAEEALYRSFLVPVEEALKDLQGSIQGEVVRAGWQAINSRRAQEAGETE